MGGSDAQPRMQCPDCRRVVRRSGSWWPSTSRVRHACATAQLAGARTGCTGSGCTAGCTGTGRTAGCTGTHAAGLVGPIMAPRDARAVTAPTQTTPTTREQLSPTSPTNTSSPCTTSTQRVRPSRGAMRVLHAPCSMLHAPCDMLRAACACVNTCDMHAGSCLW